MGYFHPVNRDAYKEVAKALENRSGRQERDDLRFAQIGFGSNKFVILPPASEDGFLHRKVFYHRNLPITDKNGREDKVFCPDWTHKGDCCPICHVTRLITKAAGGPPKSVEKFYARPRVYLNVIPLEIGGKPVEVTETSALAHILIAPSRIEDTIVQALEDSDLDNFYDYFGNGALPMKIVKTKNGPEVFNVEYTYQFVPSLRKPQTTSEAELKAIQESLYDLSKIFRYSESAWKKGVEAANKILEIGGFAPLDISEFPTLPEEFKRKEKEEGAAKPPVGDTPKKLVSVPDPKPIQPKVEGGEVVRDYTILDPTTNMPACKGYHNKSAVCVACPYEDPCVAATASRLAS